MSKKKRSRLDGLQKAASLYCKDPIEKIPGYYEAIASNEPYDLHHVLELTLDGQRARSVDELKRMGMYFKRPYFELVFLPKKEHSRIHNVGINNFGLRTKDKEAARKKQSESSKGHYGWNRGKKWSQQTREKMRLSHLGKQIPEEGIAKLRVIAKQRKDKFHEYKANGGVLSYNCWSSTIWPTVKEVA